MNNPVFQVPDTEYGPSGSIWGDCPIEDFTTPDASAKGIGYFRFIDFSKFRTSTNVNAAEAHWQDGLKVFGDNGFALTTLDELPGGQTVGSDGDNEGGSVGDMNYPFQLDRGKKAFWFECMVKFSSISNTLHGDFIGLIDASALSATVPITAAGALADENLVGFFRPEGDGDGIDTVYKANGVTAVTLQADAVVPVADTWVKLGIKFIPFGDPKGDNRLVFFKNGTRLTTSYEIPTADGTDFPNDVRLGFVAAMLNATATTPGSTSWGWAQMAQFY